MNKRISRIEVRWVKNENCHKHEYQKQTNNNNKQTHNESMELQQILRRRKIVLKEIAKEINNHYTGRL